ncbi:ubiquitin-associated domain-containing protein 2-like [Diadema setosum]|uniref:ubiquitin-associated domain-containing protein 2-like n=1 Tax=Diadema setosum TaxID=31175 RepID=UPI003B3A30A3
MSQPYTSTGFYMAPVSKAVLILTSALSSSLILLGPRYQNLFVYSTDYLLSGQELWRLTSCKLSFHELHSLLLGASLLYHFRILERRYGSSKFSSFLLANLLLCIGIEVAAVFVSHHMEYTWLPHTLSGPQSLVFALFVPYFMDIPNIATQNNLVAEAVAGKWFSYVLGIYLTTLTRTSPMAVAYGILAGTLCRANFLFVRSWARFPSFMSLVCRRTLGWLLSSRPPSEGTVPMGATLEIQRQQRVEYLEQRMLLAQAQRYRHLQRQNAFRRPVRQTFPRMRPMAEGAVPRVLDGVPTRTQDGETTSSPGINSMSSYLPEASSTSSQPPPQDSSDTPSTSNDNVGEAQTSVPEDRIKQLVDMGFNRAAVMQALQLSNNDVSMATSVLLQE